MREKRWLLCFLVAVCCTVSAWALPSQERTVTLDLHNVSIETVLDAVKKQAGVNLLYNSQMFKGVPPVSIETYNEKWEVALKLLLNPQGFDYTVKDGIVVIRKQQRETRVRGTVKDSHGEPIPGASIVVKGARTGTSTNLDGEFTLDVKDDKVTLEISFIGMKKQTVHVDATRKKMLEITLVDDVKVLDDVVVTGYGNVRKTSFTGSSTQISGDELRKVSQTNVIGALEAFDPSFRLVNNTQFGSDPNALPEMYIRGRSGFGVKELDKDQLSRSNLENNPNLPTFIMDGFEVSIEKVYDLDPARIESMTILKDAAATAIYGSRAANGVVVITTVAPKAGEVRVSYSFTGTLEMPDLRDYNLANASEKLEIERRAGLFDKGNNNNHTTADGINAYNKRYALIQKGIDTDWLTLPLQNSFDHKHSIFIEGGTPNLRYGVDASYNSGGGVMKGTGRDRYSAGFSLDYRVKKLQVKNTVTFSHTKSTASPYGSFSDYTGLQPYETPYQDNGTLVTSLFYSNKGGSSVKNPLYEATLKNYDWSAYDELINNLSLNWYLTDYLTLKGQFSVTKQYSSSERFYDPLSSKVSVPSNDNNKLQGDLYTGKGGYLKWNANAFVYYTRSFGKHNFNFSGGWEASAYNTDNTTAHYRGFPSGEFCSLNYAAEIYKKPTRTENTTRRVSGLATLNYTWNDIYLVDASARFDGSSEFGANQKWAPFFSGGVGLNIHNYEFLKGNEAINKVKIRASYGRTGKVNFPAYAATTMYESLFDEWYVTGFGAVLKALGNKDLSWEKTDKMNFGLETEFFKRRLTVGFEYYYEKTIDLINDVSLSQTSGFSSYKDNMGEVENKGFELKVRGDIYRDRNWTIALWGNMAHNKNQILKISNSQKAYNERVKAFYKKELDSQNLGFSLTDAAYSVPIPQYEEGRSLTSIWAVRSLGIDPTTGEEIFQNRDGSISKTWDAAQQVVVGDTEPTLNGSFGLNAAYRNWSLMAVFNYQFGGQEYNQTLVDRVENADIKNGNVDLRVLTDRWYQAGDVAQFKDIKNSTLTTLPTSRFVQDNALIRLTAITLGYDFDREWLKKHLRMNMLRLEVNSSDFLNWNSIRQERGLSYPKSWKVNFTLKAQF
ncbi:SusC/RagA family TonB-linked outer membrane protein [uncultured Bacteroides sp.]|uniref:SusC/RagA family TonB-linked outer membrane protein n=1 Tax=uncultured Bacteroides sp. TaxID=162156 RepID=UPI0025D158F9|nr:SusC/RagA family TonB-linked outer membrane protein [uncultured Bacteroides sp.]